MADTERLRCYMLKSSDRAQLLNLLAILTDAVGELLDFRAIDLQDTEILGPGHAEAAYFEALHKVRNLPIEELLDVF